MDKFITQEGKYRVVQRTVTINPFICFAGEETWEQEFFTVKNFIRDENLWDFLDEQEARDYLNRLVNAERAIRGREVCYV